LRLLVHAVRSVHLACGPPPYLGGAVVAAADRTKIRSAIGAGVSLETKQGRPLRVRATDEGLEFEISTGNVRKVRWQNGPFTLPAIYDDWLVADRPDSTTWFAAKGIGSLNSSYMLATFKFVASTGAGRERTGGESKPTPTEPEVGSEVRHAVHGVGRVEVWQEKYPSAKVRFAGGSMKVPKSELTLIKSP
ncbi:MAG: hypothetical protein KIT58_17175, partial [Planctomycetota bacterium]|nr:hypothetical protein [Planctomycetota bacterium]